MSLTPRARFGFPLLALLLVCAVLAAPLVLAQPASRLAVQEVLAAGGPAPGFPPDAVLESIADVPRIDAAGNVSTVALVRDPVEGSLQVLYRSLAGATELVFRPGDPAPGVSGSFVQFPDLPQTPRIQGGRLTFAAVIEEASTGGGRTGLWSDRSGSFGSLMLAGQSLPGLPAGGQVSTFDFTTRGGTVLLRASFSRGGSSLPGDRGLWRNRNGAWEALVVRDMSVPGLAGAVFGPDPTGVYGPLFAYDARSDGRVVTQSWMTGPRIDENNDEALWLETDGGLRLLVREGDRPGGRGKTPAFGPTRSTPTFGGDHENLPPVVNDLGTVLFGAVLRSGKSRFNSVWTGRSGAAPVLLVRGGVPLSGYGEGDPAPGFAPGVGFATFEQGALNERNQLAFLGFADEQGNPLDLTQAIWWDVPGRLALVAAEGRPAPGLPGVVYFNLSLETLTDEGALFFTARLAGAGITAANDRALFRADPDGSVDLVLREGDTVDVTDRAGATTARIVRSFDVARDLDQAGRGVARLAFSDGSAGVYTTVESLLAR